jgi:hypothetical protein
LTAIEPEYTEPSTAADDTDRALLRLDWHLKALRGLNVINPYRDVVRRALEWRTSAR